MLELRGTLLHIRPHLDDLRIVFNRLAQPLDSLFQRNDLFVSWQRLLRLGNLSLELLVLSVDALKMLTDNLELGLRSRCLRSGGNRGEHFGEPERYLARSVGGRQTEVG